MRADVVIGTAFGDEGKGRVVSSLATPDSLVCRFNGGAQAGHTVVHQGRPHIFSHFGSGTLVGASTYLSRFFVCHPGIFLAEYKELARLRRPIVYVSPLCQVTTPYDEAVNVLLEQKRGDRRHGSVGIGFGETIERAEQGYGLTASDVRNLSLEELTARLETIRGEWLPKRCAQVGVALDGPMASHIQCLLSDEALNGALFAFNAFRHEAVVLERDVIPGPINHIIFEGSQGLGLDPKYGFWPHVTRSACGLRNVQALLPDHTLDVYYVTRAYTTRHGAGPLEHELPHKPYEGIYDFTNLPHKWQGTLRYSYLDLDFVMLNAGRDFDEEYRGEKRAHLVVTCTDQVPETFKAHWGGKLCEFTAKDLAAAWREGDGEFYITNSPDTMGGMLRV